VLGREPVIDRHDSHARLAGQAGRQSHGSFCGAEREAAAVNVKDGAARLDPVGVVDGRLREECGVSLASLNCMIVIDATPLCRVHHIARAVAITVGGASQAVDRLESAGLCARRANPSDRRSSIVELTPQGTGLLGIAAPVLDSELDRLLRAPLPGTALTHLADALSVLCRSAAAQAGSPAAGGASKRS
jgi:MarR family transcriptional regulator, organic hydroperoxide resistance regulator